VDTKPLPKPTREAKRDQTRTVEHTVVSNETMPAVELSQPQQTQPQPQLPPVQPAGPSQADLDTASEDLMKLHTRADAVKDSLDRLRGQNAASGLGVRQDIVASASRMDSYLQAADRALQNNTLDSARKDMNRAEDELNKLEAFFGR
jgi:hypothetical protein